KSRDSCRRDDLPTIFRRVRVRDTTAVVQTDLRLSGAVLHVPKRRTREEYRNLPANGTASAGSARKLSTLRHRRGECGGRDIRAIGRASRNAWRGSRFCLKEGSTGAEVSPWTCGARRRGRCSNGSPFGVKSMH